MGTKYKQNTNTHKNKNLVNPIVVLVPRRRSCATNALPSALGCTAYKQNANTNMQTKYKRNINTQNIQTSSTRSLCLCPDAEVAPQMHSLVHSGALHTNKIQTIYKQDTNKIQTKYKHTQ